MNTFTLNENIRAHQVRLIDQEGKQLGIVPRNAALEKARLAGLDLIIITEDANPPVCKIVDAGKFQYENKKREKEIAKKQRSLQIETKEIQLRPVTGMHDIEIKSRKVKEFLDNGDKVRIVVKFKGRELSHKDMGMNVLESLLSKLGDVKLEKPITEAGKDIFVLVAPGNAAPKGKNE